MRRYCEACAKTVEKLRKERSKSGVTLLPRDPNKRKEAGEGMNGEQGTVRKSLPVQVYYERIASRKAATLPRQSCPMGWEKWPPAGSLVSDFSFRPAD
jgi:hypothetical protein